MSTRHVLLLRGINVGRGHRIPMAGLRAMLEDLGYGDVRTLLQSGNAAVTASSGDQARVRRAVETAIQDTFGMQIGVVVRSRAQLEEVLAADPLVGVADDPSRHYVGFVDPPLPDDALSALDGPGLEPERFAVVGGHLYLWYPQGQQGSPLGDALTRLRLPGVVTMRNRRTSEKLLDLAGD